ncbi:MAG TPA: antibiotic biosynthesis monooxygenase [Fimbriimonas sp.]|nr:antibiotic biosynthesis monooxygenase [Fimbriimonas sp.]
MVGEIFLARLNINGDASIEFWHAVKQMREIMQVQPGFVGFSLWIDHSDPESYLMVLEAKSEASVGASLREVVQSEAFEALQGPLEGVSSNRWIKLLARRGVTIESMPPDSFMTASVRLAEPGMADNLAADYALVFESLSVLPGFRGFGYGPANNLAEQFIGLAWWDSMDDMMRSLPAGKVPKLKFFRRVSEKEMLDLD